MSYNEFRVLFTRYATAGKISRDRWFEDVCEKVSPALKTDLRVEKYKMNRSYKALDEYLAIVDRESRKIRAEELEDGSTVQEALRQVVWTSQGHQEGRGELGGRITTNLESELEDDRPIVPTTARTQFFEGRG